MALMSRVLSNGLYSGCGEFGVPALLLPCSGWPPSSARLLCHFWLVCIVDSRGGAAPLLAPARVFASRVLAATCNEEVTKSALICSLFPRRGIATMLRMAIRDRAELNWKLTVCW